jgi:uncharacterized protein (UPF0276 family)
VAAACDCGLLLDAAHLAVYQLVSGNRPVDGLDGYPLDRVVEIHVAGGTPFTSGGLTFIDDDHGTRILPETWEILEAVVPRARNLKAVVFECERNRPDEVIPVFAALKARCFSGVGA